VSRTIPTPKTFLLGASGLLSLSQQANDSSDRKAERAIALLQRGRGNEGTALLREIQRETPTHPSVALLLIPHLIQTGNLAEALEMSNKIIENEIRPEILSYTLVARGRIYLQQGESYTDISLFSFLFSLFSLLSCSPGL
jgi:Flp pilus assembly protein TadD